MSLPLIKFFSSVHKLDNVDESSLRNIYGYTEHIISTVKNSIEKVPNINAEYIERFSIEIEEEIFKTRESMVSSETNFEDSFVHDLLMNYILSLYDSWLYEHYIYQKSYKFVSVFLNQVISINSMIDNLLNETVSFFPYGFYSSSEFALFDKLRPIELKTFIEITTQILLENFGTEVMLSTQNNISYESLTEFNREKFNNFIYERIFSRIGKVLQTAVEEKSRLLFYYSEICKKSELIKQTLRNK